MVEVEVAPWIKGLPVAPEYRPSEADFVDPISFVLRIEEEAGQFGICKIVPPTVKPRRKSLLPNLYRSIAAAGKSSGKKASIGLDANSLAGSKFTTRKQELGDQTHAQTRHSKGASYTLDQFEIKAKAFTRAQVGTSRDVVPVVLEALFWKTIEEDKPVTVEYADYIPGSAFPESDSEQGDGKKRKKSAVDREGWKLVNSPWNMRYLAKLQGSLLRFMPGEVQGVTSPLLYIAMLFSHWSWRTESHDLHFVDYLHLGAPKTWYVVPPGAAPAFEDVLRNQDDNSVVSPEVLVINGVPCCRLVQNPGEYVIVFPRAYNFSFSHSFNCGETSSLASPGWLKAAKQAAARKELLCRPPMVCHEKLLYQTALAFAKSSNAQDVRSSRLKHKMKVGAEEAVRTEFVNDMAKNQQVLDKLVSMTQARRVIFKGDDGKESLSNLVNLGTIDSISLLSFVCETMEGADEKVGDDETLGKNSPPRIDWGNVSCSICGILCYSCIVIVQPTSKASESIREGRLTVTDENHVQEDENGSSRKVLPPNGSRKAGRDNLQRPYIMCSEHALQVSLLLQGCGGSLVLVVYHPEYEMFDKNAKDFAMDMSMRCRFRDTTYDEENQQDLQLISAAIEAAERPDNGWIDHVQARLPATASFLENSRAETDEDDTELVVEKTSKEKKVVGRWCGRVWRHDQTHAILGGCRTASKVEDNQDELADSKTRKSKGGHDEDILKSEDYASLRKNCRKRKRTQMVAVWRVESEPQPCSTQISESLPSELEANDVKTEKVASLDEDVKVSEPELRTENRSSEEGRPLPPLVCKEEKEENGKLELPCPEETTKPLVIVDCKEEPEIHREAVVLDEEAPQENVAAYKEVLPAPPEEPEQQSKEKEPDPVAAENEPVSVVITEDDGQHGAGSTLCFSNSVWHDVPISFSPTFHSSYMDEKPKAWPTAHRTPLKIGIPKRKRTQIASSLEASDEEKQLTDEDLEEDYDEEEEAEEDEEEQNYSNVSASSVEDDERAVDEAAEYGLESRAKRTKRKSWKAQAAEEQEKAPRRGGAKKASTSTKRPGSEATKRKLAPGMVHSHGLHTCDFDGCTMSFRTASELALHKRNICTIKECSKRLCSHSYLMQHYRVHADDRPLKCPWKGCKKTFKWSWARTEHIRVHTGERPYACTECGKSYRFVSDFSRHKRTTGHST
ncbi:hypothetical protein SELMODRAFT_404286 [Selaginella moellendorffii]|uniref:JmjC domain-containing protein n=1 Tax=Selaginella moellendorffii TaxID=88036 RepID=D8QUV3_SELML|nr:probable lysine-specific demethylase ELF6 [Selaginella moellendorffii]EFJ35938.1 hypothetical protein SELMODRAFT_404286 [Selaginella moellendorffii]|eukprot:XP_002962475.1 probable lysine-specific demethylase ELF6 [Selaginella moellendorffii]